MTRRASNQHRQLNTPFAGNVQTIWKNPQFHYSLLQVYLLAQSQSDRKQIYVAQLQILTTDLADGSEQRRCVVYTQWWISVWAQILMFCWLSTSFFLGQSISIGGVMGSWSSGIPETLDHAAGSCRDSMGGEGGRHQNTYSTLSLHFPGSHPLCSRSLFLNLHLLFDNRKHV